MICLAQNKLNVAVIGGGVWGKKLIGEYLSLSRKRDDVHLAFVVDKDKDRLALLSNEFNLPSNMLLTDARDVFKDESVQAVHIATPNVLHFEQAMAAMDAHKNVLVEKPLSLTMRDAIKLARRAEEEALVLHVGHIFRFNNAVKETRRLIQENAIGRLFYFSLRWETLISPPGGRDIVFDLAPHPIDILNFLYNEWPARVLSIGRSFLRNLPDKEEVAEAIVEFEDDVFAPISLSWLFAGPKRRVITVTGQSGVLETDAIEQRITIYKNGKSEQHPVKANNTIETMIDHFANCILRGGVAQNSALIGAMTVGVLTAMRESARKKQFIDVLGGGN